MKVKCWNCNKKINIDLRSTWADSKGYYNRESMNPPDKPWKRFYCESCAKETTEQFEQEKQVYVRLKNKMLFERAIKILETQKMDFYKYEEAIKAVYDFSQESPEKFDSAYEMIAAIILINERIQTKLQYNIGRYRVDFFLPDLKCILEVDGERHEEKLLEDSNRDIKIRAELGAEWEIVRVPTEYLELNAKMLPKAIIELKKAKQEIRLKNGGIIPAHYSKRDKAKAIQVDKIAKGK